MIINTASYPSWSNFKQFSRLNMTGTLFLEFNSKMKLGDKMTLLQNNLKNGGIYYLSSVIISECSEEFSISKHVSITL